MLHHAATLNKVIENFLQWTRKLGADPYYVLFVTIICLYSYCHEHFSNEDANKIIVLEIKQAIFNSNYV
jgi:hypothetical protein